MCYRKRSQYTITGNISTITNLLSNKIQYTTTGNIYLLEQMCYHKTIQYTITGNISNIADVLLLNSSIYHNRKYITNAETILKTLFTTLKTMV